MNLLLTESQYFWLCWPPWWKTQPWPNPIVGLCSQLVDRQEILASHWLSGSVVCEYSAERCAYGNMATGLAVAEICTAKNLKHKSCPLCTAKVANQTLEKRENVLMQNDDNYCVSCHSHLSSKLPDLSICLNSLRIPFLQGVCNCIPLRRLTLVKAQ